MRETPRTFAKGPQPLRLERARTPLGEFVRHGAHATAQCFELGGTANRTLRRQRFALRDALRPANQFVERTAQLPAQVPRDARNDQRDDAETEEGEYDQYGSRSINDELQSPRLSQRLTEFALMVLDRYSLPG